jgi:hypothetical protein
MGNDIGVFICWGIAYSFEDLECFAEGSCEHLKNNLEPGDFARLQGFWQTPQGDDKRLQLLERLQLIWELQEFSEEADASGSILAESGCSEIEVHAIRRWRAYNEEAELDAFIVGFRSLESVIYNPKRLRGDELDLGPSWGEELKKFTTFEGLPCSTAEDFKLFRPGWLMYVVESCSADFEILYADSSEQEAAQPGAHEDCGPC